MAPKPCRACSAISSAPWGTYRVFATTDVLNHQAAPLFQRLSFRQVAHLVEASEGQLGSEDVFDSCIANLPGINGTMPL